MGQGGYGTRNYWIKSGTGSKPKPNLDHPKTNPNPNTNTIITLILNLEPELNPKPKMHDPQEKLGPATQLAIETGDLLLRLHIPGCINTQDAQ